MIVYTGAGSVVVPIPPSVNNLYPTVNGRRVIGSAYRKWLKVAVPLLRTLAKVDGYPVAAELVVEERVSGTRDLDNMVKPVLDACKKAGVIIDDNRSCVSSISITYRPHPMGQGVVVSFK